MSARGRSLVAVVAFALMAGGCGDSGRPPAVASNAAATAPAGNAREEAAALAARGDYAAAERKYRDALQREPDDVELHFGLGSMLSQLDRRDDAAEQFRWVVQHGRLGRPEVDSARRWLADAGDSAAGQATAAATTSPDTPTGSVRGKLTWPGIPADKQLAIRVVVQAEPPGATRKIVRSKLNDTYAVPELPEGTYTLTALAGPMRVWSDVPVTVTAGRPTVLDLTPSNAAVSPADFPARVR